MLRNFPYVLRSLILHYSGKYCRGGCGLTFIVSIIAYWYRSFCSSWYICLFASSFGCFRKMTELLLHYLHVFNNWRTCEQFDYEKKMNASAYDGRRSRIAEGWTSRKKKDEMNLVCWGESCGSLFHAIHYQHSFDVILPFHKHVWFHDWTWNLKSTLMVSPTIHFVILPHSFI